MRARTALAAGAIDVQATRDAGDGRSFTRWEQQGVKTDAAAAADGE